jgi:hypothetical protein
VSGVAGGGVVRRGVSGKCGAAVSGGSVVRGGLVCAGVSSLMHPNKLAISTNKRMHLCWMSIFSAPALLFFSILFYCFDHNTQDIVLFEKKSQHTLENVKCGGEKREGELYTKTRICDGVQDLQIIVK